VEVYIDDRLVSPEHGFVLRLAPGIADFDFGQTIFFHDETVLALYRPIAWLATAAQDVRELGSLVDDYVVPYMPCGALVTIVIHSTCGDLHYVGLNGLALLDEDGVEIPLAASSIAAAPSRYEKKAGSTLLASS
jgi:hypothetical protein